MRGDKVGASTVLAQIVRLVAQAPRSHAPVRALAYRGSFWFVVAVLAMSLSSVPVVANALKLRAATLRSN